MNQDMACSVAPRGFQMKGGAETERSQKSWKNGARLGAALSLAAVALGLVYLVHAAKAPDSIGFWIDDGIYVTSGGPNADRVTGDFSSTVDFGFKIENGEIAYPIRNAAIGGSFLEFLNDIDEVSSDYREDPGEKMPTIRVRKIRLAGSG
jgi:hypothetical protein